MFKIWKHASCSIRIDQIQKMSWTISFIISTNVSENLVSSWPIGYRDIWYHFIRKIRPIWTKVQQNSFISRFSVGIPNFIWIDALGEKLEMFNIFLLSFFERESLKDLFLSGYNLDEYNIIYVSSNFGDFVQIVNQMVFFKLTDLTT